MAILGKLLVQLEANSAKFTSEMEKASKSIDKLKSSVGLIKLDSIINLGERAFRTGQQIFNLAKTTVDWADDLVDTSKAIGMTVSQLQRWQFIARTSGVDQQQMNVGLRTFINNMDAAKKGTGEAAEAFREAGVTSMDLDEALLQVADHLSKMKEGTEKAALAMKLFGSRAGLSMIEIMDLGRQKIAAAAQRMRELGLEFGDDKINALANYKSKIEEMSMMWKVFAVRVTPVVLKGLNEIGEALSWWASKLDEFNSKEQKFVAQGLLFAKGQLKEIEAKQGAGEGTPKLEAEAEKFRAYIKKIEGIYKESVVEIKKDNNEIVDSIEAVTAEIQNLWGLGEQEQAPAGIKKWVKDFDELTYAFGDDMKALGIVSQKSLEVAAQSAIDYVDKVKQMAAAGKATSQDLVNAYNAASEAMKKLPKTAAEVANELTSINSTKIDSLISNEDDYQKATKALQEKFPERGEAYKKELQLIIDKWQQVRKEIENTAEKSKLELKVTSNVDEAKTRLDKLISDYNNKTITLNVKTKETGGGEQLSGLKAWGQPIENFGVTGVTQESGPGIGWGGSGQAAEDSWNSFKDNLRMGGDANITFYGEGSTRKPIGDKIKEIIAQFGGIEAAGNAIQAKISFIGASAEIMRLEQKLKNMEIAAPGIGSTVQWTGMSFEMQQGLPYYLQQQAFNVLDIKSMIEQLSLQQLGTRLEMGDFQHGTDYVPKTGLYRLHRGESVLPEGVSVGDVNITIENVGGTDATVDAIVEALKYKLSGKLSDALRRN